MAKELDLRYEDIELKGLDITKIIELLEKEIGGKWFVFDDKTKH